jgi:hypothetical protein
VFAFSLPQAKGQRLARTRGLVVSYDLKIVPNEDYLHVTVHGINSPETVLGYLSEVRDACVRHASKKVLIEENLQGPGLGVVGIFEVVTKASTNVWPAILRIAYVDVNPEHDPKTMKFAETVASNRGVNVRVFSGVEHAEQWLVSERISSPANQE